MKLFLRLAFTFLCVQWAVFSANSVTVHTIGDSTMADYQEDATDKRGWAMMFQQFFKAGATVNNRAKSGASSKSFYQEAPYWTTVKKQIQTGDYVLIQFAHNDEKNGGLDGDDVKLTDPTADYRGTTAQGTYKKYLRAYINETRALGATPILVTPICRKYFSGSTITRKGQHDLGEDFGLSASDNTHDYVSAMKEVATELSVELIDITAKTKSLYESYGDAACTNLLFCADDATHTNAMGGTLIARLCAQAMTAQGILADYVNAASDLLVNPGKCDFDKAYAGQRLVKELTISGFDLQPASGTCTLSLTDGFTIAASKTGAFTSSLSLSYSNGNLDFSKFYIATMQSTAGKVAGTLTISNGSVTKTVPLSASFITLEGGTEVSLKWELASAADYVLDGPAIAVEQSFMGMYQQRFAAPNSKAVWPVESGYDAGRTTQRNLIDGDTWPAGDIDEVSTRYIQFGIAANPGSKLNIDSIGLYVCGAGGNGMKCRISYSTNNFADYTAIAEFASMVANNLYPVSSQPVVELHPGDTLLLRVYPWYGGQATGKTICLADVQIHGVTSPYDPSQEQEEQEQEQEQEQVTAISTSVLEAVSWQSANGHFVLQGLPANSSLELVNISGQKLQTIKNATNTTISMDAPHASGIYFCRISSALGVRTLKFIVP